MKYSIIKNLIICGIIFLSIFLTGFFIGRNYPDIFYQAIDKLNHFSTLITAIATVALVVATLYLAYDNSKMLKAQDKPYLYFYVKQISLTNPNLGEGLYVKNAGKGPAFKIKMEIESINISIPSIEVLSPKDEVLVDSKLNFKMVSEGIKIKVKYNDIFDGIYDEQKEISHYDFRLII